MKLADSENRKMVRFPPIQVFPYEWPRLNVLPDKDKPTNGGLTDREMKWIP